MLPTTLLSACTATGPPGYWITSDSKANTDAGNGLILRVWVGRLYHLVTCTDKLVYVRCCLEQLIDGGESAKADIYVVVS